MGRVDVFTRFIQKYVHYSVMQLYISRDNEEFQKVYLQKDYRNLMEKPESRREWMPGFSKKSCHHLKRPQAYKVGHDGYHAEEVYSKKWIREKINHIHQNPVREKVVGAIEEYCFSSAKIILARQ